AFGVVRTKMRGKKIVNISIVISFASPPFLMAIAYVMLLGPNAGYINRLLRYIAGSESERGPLDVFSLYGFAFLAIPAATALLYLGVMPVLVNMDSAMEEAARVGGATPLQTLKNITLPIMRPGILSEALLAFSKAFAMYAVPQVLGLDVLPISIRRALLVTNDFEEAATIALISSVFSMIVLYLYRRSIRTEAQFRTITGKGAKTVELELGALRHVFTIIGSLFAFFAAALPYTILVLISFMKVPARGLASGNFTLGN